MAAKIFAGSASPNLAKLISQKSKIPLGKIEVGHFSDTESDVWIQEDVNNANVFIVQSTSAPTNDHIIELALIADALKRSGANKITAVIPYYGYARKEKQSREGEPISAKVVANILTTSGITKVITVDLHADPIVGFFDVPVVHLSAKEVLAAAVKGERLTSPVVVAPDVGGVRRARNFASLLEAPLVVIEKKRNIHERETLEVLSISGESLGETAIILDDIISTGTTIIKAAEALKAKGVKRVLVCATHGVLAGDAVKNLENSTIDKVIVTDTITTGIKSKKIEIASTAPLLANCLREEI
ncbi:MAG: ribose-phosphate diphosphokinase [Candidatus Curtissbacteria bacterium]|nr:ribose-phosphate diphosphokinase [Candidatus Curtissbacteria bacterium]